MTEHTYEQKKCALDYLKGHGRWYPVPYSALKYLATRGSYRDRIVAALIIQLEEAGRWCFPASRGKLCSETRLHARTVDRILDELKAAGVVYFDKRGRGKQRIFCFTQKYQDAPIIAHPEDASTKAQPEAPQHAPDVSQQDAPNPQQQRKEPEIKDKKDSLSIFEIFSQEFSKIKGCPPPSMDIEYMSEVDRRYRVQLASHAGFDDHKVIQHYFQFHLKGGKVHDLKTMLHPTWISVYLGSKEKIYPLKKNNVRHPPQHQEQEIGYCTNEENLKHLERIKRIINGQETVEK